MTVQELNLHLATLQARLLGAGKQLDDPQRKEVERDIAHLRECVGSAVLPPDLGAEELVEQALKKTAHIKAPDFTNLVGGQAT